MSIQTDLRTYHDIRKLVTPSAFTGSMAYISWHNRLAMTAMLETWQALVVALVFEKKAIDGLLFSAVKAFLDENLKVEPQTLEDCRMLAAQLMTRLFPEK